MWKNKKSSKDLADQRIEVLKQNESQEPYEVRRIDIEDNIGLSDDKNICHGLGCSNYATHSIQEDGYDGILNLCDNCIKKFPREVTDELQTFNNSFPEQYAPTPRPISSDQSNGGRSKL